MIYRVLDWVALILLIIGGLNLGVVGLFNYDLIIDLFAEHLLLAHALFFCMGLAAFYMLFRASLLLRKLKPL